MQRWIAVTTLVLALSPLVRAQPVYFADANLKAEVAAELGVSNPTAADMLGLSSLSAWGLSISDLTGLEYATNLEYLDLSSNLISDLTPLDGLTNLEELYLWDNQISDPAPLAALTNLTGLDLGSNQISNLTPLAGLTNLKWLYLSGNQISDIQPLADNAGLGSGDRIKLYDSSSGRDNPLSTTSCTVYITQLQGKGVEVYHNCP